MGQQSLNPSKEIFVAPTYARRTVLIDGGWFVFRSLFCDCLALDLEGSDFFP